MWTFTHTNVKRQTFQTFHACVFDLSLALRILLKSSSW